MRFVDNLMLSICFFCGFFESDLGLPLTVFLFVFIPHARAAAASATAFIRLWFLGFVVRYYLFVLHYKELVSTNLVQKSKV
jgi:hypothetical protein